MRDTELDIVIVNGTVVFKDEVQVVDIGIKDGKITRIANGLKEEATQVFDASGLTVMAGMIDAHVHLNEPGTGHWEGFRTGSAALAAGGCTTYIDMPLNGVPPTVTTQALKQKLEAASGNSYIDYALWGGLVPGQLDQLIPLHHAGVIGFKAFMSSPGGPSEEEFREVDDATLLEGMKIIATTGKVLSLHAESEAMVNHLTNKLRSEGRSSWSDFVASRPIEAELEAIQRALHYAKMTGCAIHIVHVSSEAGIMAVASARANGINVTAETCPHYLILNELEMERQGVIAKCAPPLRSANEQEQLWHAVKLGHVDLIASDHSPSPVDLKRGHDFFECWGGIAGAQSSMELMIGEGHCKRGIPLPQLSRMLSYEPAKRFGLLSNKGEIRIGADADLTIMDLNAAYTLSAEHLQQRHKISPYIGKKMNVSVHSVFSRGQQVYDFQNGLINEAAGQWLRQG